MAAWKQKVKAAWDSIEIKSVKVPDPTVRPLNFGENFIAEVTLNTPALDRGDIAIELIFGRKLHDKINEIVFVEKMEIIGNNGSEVTYYINVPVNRPAFTTTPSGYIHSIANCHIVKTFRL